MPIPNILIIDPDATAARELSTWLLSRPKPPKLFLASDVAAAESIFHSQPIAGLFIRIDQWDGFQALRTGPSAPSLHSACLPDANGATPRIVFLSGRNDKCTGHLRQLLPAHLQPPYRVSGLLKTWNYLTSPNLEPHALDFFFLKVHAHYVKIEYRDLEAVRAYRGQLRIQTRQGEYEVHGSLAAFTNRLPIPLAFVRRGWVVNENYDSR